MVSGICGRGYQRDLIFSGNELPCLLQIVSKQTELYARAGTLTSLSAHFLNGYVIPLIHLFVSHQELYMLSARPGSGRNHQFDLMRILFAVMVLLSHASEMTYGDRSHEIVARLTTRSFSSGMLGVDGFFLLSGYLIVKSWITRPRLFDYMAKRFLRIAPGYGAAVIAAFLVVGWLAPVSDHFFHELGIRSFRSVLFVFTLQSPPVFPGSESHYLNRSLWTILYEFRCYVVVAIFGVTTLLQRRAIWALCTVILFLRWLDIGFMWHLKWPQALFSYLGDPDAMSRLASVFFIGGCFYLFEDRIAFRPAYAAGCVLGILAVCLAVPSRAEFAIVTLGAYLIFYSGSRRISWLSWMKKVPDLSYGIYLYGWPVESLLIWYFHSSPWFIFVESTIICAALAWLSWNFVEAPALKLKRRLPAAPWQISAAATEDVIEVAT